MSRFFEAEEGLFFLWTPAQIGTVLNNKREAQLALSLYGVTEDGNFDSV